MTMIFGPASQSFISQRMKIHYVEWGSPANPPLLLLHGARDHCRSWDWAARDLAADWHVIAPDLRGHGDSDWASDGFYSIAAYLYDLRELIRVRDLAPLSIVAHSLGGAIASRYAALFPDQVERLLLVDGLGTATAEQNMRRKLPIEERLTVWLSDRAAFSRRRPRRYASLSEAATRMRTENPNLSVEQSDHLTLHGMRRNEDDSYSWKFDNLQRLMPPLDGTEEDYIDLLSTISVPTRLLWGSASYTTHPAKSARAKAIASLEVVYLEGAGHWPHHDDLPWFLQQARDFLKRADYAGNLV